MKYNHNRDVSDFKENIDKIKSKGFNIIGVSQILKIHLFLKQKKRH